MEEAALKHPPEGVVLAGRSLATVGPGDCSPAARQSHLRGAWQQRALEAERLRLQAARLQSLQLQQRKQEAAAQAQARPSTSRRASGNLLEGTPQVLQQSGEHLLQQQLRDVALKARIANDEEKLLLQLRERRRKQQYEQLLLLQQQQRPQPSAPQPRPQPIEPRPLLQPSELQLQRQPSSSPDDLLQALPPVSAQQSLARFPSSVVYPFRKLSQRNLPRSFRLGFLLAVDGSAPARYRAVARIRDSRPVVIVLVKGTTGTKRLAAPWERIARPGDGFEGEDAAGLRQIKLEKEEPLGLVKEEPVDRIKIEPEDEFGQGDTTKEEVDKWRG